MELPFCLSHLFFFVIVWLVFFNLGVFFVCFNYFCCFFPSSRRSKDKDKTFLHHESLQTTSPGILLAKLAKGN